MNSTGQNNPGMNDNSPPHATEDMLADLGLSGADTEQLRSLLGEVAGLAHEVPEPSDDVRALLGGAVPLRSRPGAGGTARARWIVAVSAGALALGGVSAAAATNRLPDRVQEVVADATGGAVPHPVKPTNPPEDAPGHVFKEDDDEDSRPSDAPGQIQKSTKPDPTAPGPARPEDPGSHGREHNDSDNGGDNAAPNAGENAAVNARANAAVNAGDNDNGKGQGRGD